MDLFICRAARKRGPSPATSQNGGLDNFLESNHHTASHICFNVGRKVGVLLCIGAQDDRAITCETGHRLEHVYFILVTDLRDMTRPGQLTF